MNTQKATQEYRRNKWIEIIRECRDSGQTVASWCKDHGINSKSYYYWLKKIRIAACNALPAMTSQVQIVPLDIQEVSTSPSTTATHAPSETDHADIVLHLNSAVLQIHNNASSSLIESTIRALYNAR
jgi:putative transposase